MFIKETLEIKNEGGMSSYIQIQKILADINASCSKGKITKQSELKDMLMVIKTGNKC